MNVFNMRPLLYHRCRGKEGEEGRLLVLLGAACGLNLMAHDVSNGTPRITMRRRHAMIQTQFASMPSSETMTDAVQKMD